MLLGLTAPQITFLVILTAAFVLLITEKVRNDLVAVLIIVSLALTGLLKPDQALSGFASEPAIVVASIFVLTGALELTGVSNAIGLWIGRLAGRTYSRSIAVIMPAVALLSAFTHHVTTTAIMLPITIEHAKERAIPASKLLMPMSFAASLGTTITIIGAPAFLVASAVLQQSGRAGLSVFSIAPVGLALSLAGTVFVLLIGRWLLPSRAEGGDLLQRFRLDRYFTEMSIQPDSPLIGQKYQDVKERGTYDFKVTRWIRSGQELRVPHADLEFQPGDVLVIETTPEDLVTIRQERGIDLAPAEKYRETMPSHDSESDVNERLVQAVVAPNAEIIGQTIGEVDFRHRWGVLVVGLWRQSGFLRQQLSAIRLEAGDVLVMEGENENLENIAREPSFLMMVPFHGEGRSPRKALLAAVIMLATVVLASTSVVPLSIATLIGAAAVVLTQCITPRQAYRAIDQRIFVFIAGAIPLGVAMQNTGTSDVVARWLQGAVGGWQPFWVLMVIFLLTSWITQLMSDSATTALFAPVVVALAKALGQPPEPYVITVAMAAVASFWTPIGHHGNLLIYGPGRYTFKDFLLVGGLLTILVAFIVVWLALRLWGSLPPIG